MIGEVICIIQARMGSERLPGKTLAPILEKPLLQHVIERVAASTLVEGVILATTDKAEDDPVADLAQKLGVKCFRGSENDVLDRTYQAAQKFNVEHIVRVNGDCPLIDPKVIDRVVEVYLSGQYDYVTNILTFPDGQDVEAFARQALERAWKEAHAASDREHVTAYIRKAGSFRVFEVRNSVDLSHLKWSVDTEDDLKFVRAVNEQLGVNGAIFHMEDVIQALEDFPKIASINQVSVRDEGYYRSIANDPPLHSHVLDVSRSQVLKERGLKLIPSLTQTFSKGPTQLVQGVAPVYLARGQGSHVWDADGNEFIDYPMGLAAVILGHNYPSVTEAVARQMQDGVSFSLPHLLELELAELLVDIIPCAEMVRFGKNGSDATSGAVRVGRAFTGRDIIACCGYHGWQDWYIGTTTRNKGVPQAVRELTVPFQYNDISSLERIFDDHPEQVAAVIMEPIGVVEPQDRFLFDVQDLARRNGALLIFDEIITGCRLELGGAQARFGVVPDLACFGKGMANGYPLSAVVGRRDVMELFDEVFFSFTFGGETLSLAAAIATIHEMQQTDVIPHLWGQGRKLKDGYNTLARNFGVERYTECIGLAPRTVITFKDEEGTGSLPLQSLFQQECLKRGVLFAAGHNLCYSHSDQDVDHTLRVYRTALEILAQAIGEDDISDKLEGQPIEPVFRRA